MAVASLSVSKTYADGQSLTEAKLDTSFQSIQTYTNTSVVNNFNQLRKDAFGTVYDYDNDGNANRTNTLFNKQSGSASYTTGLNMSLSGTFSTWTNVSASMNLVFTAEATGKYMLMAQFSHEIEHPAGDAFETNFTLWNSTAATTIGHRVRHRHRESGAVEFSITPIFLHYIFNIATTSAATYTVRYNIPNRSSVTTTNDLERYYISIHKI